MDTNSIIGVYALTLNACSLFTNVNPTAIGIMSVHGHRIDNDETTIIVSRMTVTDMTIGGDRTKALIYIATTDIEQMMFTTDMMITEMTGTNHDIHGTIDVTLIEVHAIIDGPPIIVAENLYTPNLKGFSHTLSRGTTRPTNGLTPRLHGSPLTVHTIVFKTTEAKQGTQRRSPV